MQPQQLIQLFLTLELHVVENVIQKPQEKLNKQTQLLFDKQAKP